jgi:8-oxo-dGTP pyrophosphatase MutT (NUDIX family)
MTALSLAAVRDLAQAGLRRHAPLAAERGPAVRSDFDLEGGRPAPQALKPAAVLIAIIDRPAGATVLFTQRAMHLRHHPGQISFPGGRVDDADGSVVSAALREAEEEIGLPGDAAEPLGFLDPYVTGTGYRIVPVVAALAALPALALNPEEVDEVFEAPLAFLLDLANFREERRLWQGRERRYYAVPYGERYIWGATAGILRNLHDRLMPHAATVASR